MSVLYLSVGALSQQDFFALVVVLVREGEGVFALGLRLELLNVVGVVGHAQHEVLELGLPPAVAEEHLKVVGEVDVEEQATVVQFVFPVK